MKYFGTNEKTWPQSTIVVAALLSASVSLLWEIYISEGFESNVDAIFRKLTPAIISILLAALVSLWILLWRGPQARINTFASVAIILISHLIYYTLIQSFFHYTIDDTFITFRYSRNLADGFGPTFNPGMAPVEGYSTFLWMLVMSISHVMGFDALVFSKLLGIALGEMTIIFSMLTAAEITDAREPTKKLMAGAITSLFIAAFYPMAIHTVSGMETILFTALLACTVYLAVLSDTSRMALILTPFAMLLLGLTRPEGNLLNAGLLVVLYFTGQPENRKFLLYSTVLFYIVPGILYFAWRLSYYQILFPLPYYSKLGNNLRPEGLADVVSFILTLAPSVMIPLLFTLRKVGRRQYIVAVPIILLLLFYIFPQHIMGIYSRFVFPVAPLIYALAGAGAANLLAEFIWGRETKPGYIKSALSVVCIAFVALSPLADISSIRNQTKGAVRAINPYIYFGRLLRAFPSSQPMTLAIGDAGAIPYYSQWNTIDLVGLNDPNTLFRSSTSSYLEYVFKNEPDLILLTFNDPESPVRDVKLTSEIYEAALAHGMQKVGVVKVSDTYYLWVCTEPNTPLGEYLQEALNAKT